MKEKEEQRIQAIIRLMQTDGSVDAAAADIKWAKNLFRSRQAEPSAIRRLLAVLSVDLAAGGPVFGERSAAASQARQMMYDTGEFAVDLRISSGKKGLSVRGQVLGNVAAGKIAAKRAAGKVTVAEISDQGEFDLGTLPIGIYEFSITINDVEIIIPNVELNK